VIELISKADHSAARLVNLLADNFPNFRDETRFEKKSVRILKRAQIFVADLWAAFEGVGYGQFDDIDTITTFAGLCALRAFHETYLNFLDYRIPQMLHTLGALYYSPPLDAAIRSKREIPSGSGWEVQIRGAFTPQTQSALLNIDMAQAVQSGASSLSDDVFNKHIRTRLPVLSLLISFYTML
jgi:hypothetical protein